MVYNSWDIKCMVYNSWDIKCMVYNSWDIKWMAQKRQPSSKHVLDIFQYFFKVTQNMTICLDIDRVHQCLVSNILYAICTFWGLLNWFSCLHVIFIGFYTQFFNWYTFRK